MSWHLIDQDVFGRAYKLFATDDVMDGPVVERARENQATAIKISGRSLQGRGLRKLGFLDALPLVVNLELWDPGSIEFSPEVLERLEVLKIFGKSRVLVEPERLPRLRFFAGKHRLLGPSPFGPELRALSIDSWQDSGISALGAGPSIEHLSLGAVGQRVSLDGMDCAGLRLLEMRNAEVGSLAGLQGARMLETLSLQPGPKGPSELRPIDLAPLAASHALRWLRVGRQGPMRNMRHVAQLPDISQVHGYRSFFEPDYLDAPWADPIEDSDHVRRLFGDIL